MVKKSADIPEYEGLYQVSNFGRVKSLDRYVKYSDTKKAKRKGKFKSLRTEKDGYLIVDLYRGKDSGTTYRYKTFKVHRLGILADKYNMRVSELVRLAIKEYLKYRV